MSHKKNITAQILALMLTVGGFINPPSVWAQYGFTGIRNEAIGDLGNSPVEAAAGTTFITYLVFIWNAIISVGALAVLLFFIWGAIEWISAGGDAAKVSKARDRIIQSIIGLVLLVGSFVIVGFISNLFFGDNFDILRPTVILPG